MAHNYYRRNAVLRVGGFDEELQVMEHVDVIWKLEKAGYTVKRRDIRLGHHHPIDRFTLRNVFKHAFIYGYCWHKLYHKHPDKTGLSAMPVKLSVFAIFVFVSYFYPCVLWALATLLSLWFAFKLYRVRIHIKKCIARMERNLEKLGALIILLFVMTLAEIARELGKLYAILKS